MTEYIHRSSIPLLSVVILNYNGRSFILDCLRTVLNSNYPAFEVILVDNCSKDDSTELVGRVYGTDKRLRIIVNRENLGFAAGNNVGLAHSRGDVVIFLNCDTQVDPDWLSELARIFISYDDVGVAQCMLMEMFDKRRIQGTGVLLTPVGWPDARPKAVTNSATLPNILASGAAFVIRRNIVDMVGAFDPDYFMGFEDVDLSLRVWLSGHRVVLAEKSLVYHFDPSMHSADYVRETTPVREFHASKNVIATLLKNLQLKSCLKFLPTTLAFTICRGLYFAVKARDPRRISFTVEGICWTLLNIRRILGSRYIVQTRIRKVSDEYVLRNICTRSGLVPQRLGPFSVKSLRQLCCSNAFTCSGIVGGERMDLLTNGVAKPSSSYATVHIEDRPRAK